LANYKSNLYNLQALEENKQLSLEVYNIVQLQYREGIKNYLNVITAESDLRTSEINYLDALFQLLLSKIDLQKAMGNISTNI
jgi:outer membrane protein TolC